MVKIIRRIATGVPRHVAPLMFSMAGASTVEKDTTVTLKMLWLPRRLYHLLLYHRHLHPLHRTLSTRILVKVSAAWPMVNTLLASPLGAGFVWCKDLCLQYKWCLAVEKGKIRVLLITDTEAFITTGKNKFTDENDQWGATRTFDGRSYQTYCGGSGQARRVPAYREFGGGKLNSDLSITAT